MLATLLNEVGMAAGLCVGLAVIGAAIGIGRIGGSAARAISRTEDKQARREILSTMLVSSALIEGVALFAVVLGLLMVNSL